MKKKIKIALLAIVLLVLVGGYSFVDKNNAMYDTKVDDKDYVATVFTQGGTVSQKFISTENTLDGVSMKLAATGDRDAIVVSYQLKDVESDQVIERGQTSLKQLKSGKFFEFKFDTIKEVKNKTFDFVLTVDSCSEGSSLTTYFTPDKEQLVIRTITHRFDMETFIVSLCFVFYIILFVRWLYKLFK